MELPNQSITWGRDIESFDAWKARQSALYASDETALGCYLQEQLKLETAPVGARSFNHPVIGLLSYMGEENNRAQELLLAYLSLTVGGQARPARDLVDGKRLNPHLHPEYVARTRCYG